MNLRGSKLYNPIINPTLLVILDQEFLLKYANQRIDFINKMDL